MSDPYNLVRKGGKTLEEEAIIRHQEAVERKSKNLDRVYLDGKSVLNSIFKESYGETTKIPMGSVDLKITAAQIQQLRNKTGENDMTTLQTVNVTLVDNNSNLRGEAKIVFKKHNHLTEYGVEDTKMNIISEGGVKEALIKHNTEVRLKTVDKDIQRSTGRDVMLEPIELLSDSDLEWRYVVIG